jgi:predicted RNA binding protein YcfA (HicA-like mRNA interferase family)
MATIQALRMIRALVRLGWTLDRVAGSHHIPRGRPRTRHGPREEGRHAEEGTARSILRQAGIGEDEFFDAY